MNKKIYLLAATIVIILIILFVVGGGTVNKYLVEKYYPTMGCDINSSSIEATGQECRCLGLKISRVTFGSSKSICIGKRTDFQCWNRGSDGIKRVVECE